MSNSSVPCALITGVTGQDGAYLADFLLQKGYIVHGIKRRSSIINTQRVDHLFNAPNLKDKRFFLHYGDMTDASSLSHLIQTIKPTEIYNLAAQSHVQVSFSMPEYTTDVVALGTLRLLEATRLLSMEKDVKIYQASSSEMFGDAPVPQSEKTPFIPNSPYAIAKIYAYWIMVNYRESYGLHACNGILFNHESPLRGETFVTRKICRAVARIHLGQQEELVLGNLEARRDWGHAKDYVEGMWRIMQHSEPDDFVLATGKTYSVRDFVELAFSKIGVKISWRGQGIDEVGFNSATDKVLVRVNARYFRPKEVNHLCGDASKAKKLLGWEPKISFNELVDDMVAQELEYVQYKK